ncbi:large ribosomal subunit protein mL54 [Anolis sagrei]|uniref:large ribosomal subunit protein mL54 n=1 Tax=Anolis sagrei TaxID=38937 RepID=UPI003521E6B1
MAACGLGARLALRGRGFFSSLCPGVGLRGYAKKAVTKSKGKSVAKEALQGPEVCKDPILLTTHAMGAHIYKEGPPVALKPDAEYPEWLFQMHIGPPKKLEELDPDTLEYWRLLRRQTIRQRNKVGKTRPF